LSVFLPTANFQFLPYFSILDLTKNIVSYCVAYFRTALFLQWCVKELCVYDIAAPALDGKF